MKKTFWKKCTVRGTAAALALALTFSLGAPLALAAQPEEPEIAAAAQTQEAQETDRPTLQPETPELAAEDPEAPPAQATAAEENSVNQHTPENSVVLTPEQISEALDAGALNEAEAQCLDFGSENGFWTWLVNFLFGWLDKAEPVYSGWRTTGGKTYYYSSTTHEPVTGIQSIDDKLYYFDADGVLQKGKTFGVDVSKYQKNIDWEQIKKAGVSFVIVRIGYRGYGASGALVLDPMFEEHFTNVKNAGLKVGVYFFSQATTEEEAKEEAFACAYVLNGRKLDYPIFFDTEASGASGVRVFCPRLVTYSAKHSVYQTVVPRCRHAYCHGKDRCGAVAPDTVQCLVPPLKLRYAEPRDSWRVVHHQRYLLLYSKSRTQIISTLRRCKRRIHIRQPLTYDSHRHECRTHQYHSFYSHSQ